MRDKKQTKVPERRSSAGAGPIAALTRENARLVRALTRARKREEELQAFFENARDVLVCLDEDGRMTEINRPVMEVFGYTPEEIVGRLYSEVNVLPPQTLRGLDEFSLNPTRGDRVEFEARRKDGARIFVEVTYRALRTGKSGPRFICIVRDVTDRKEMEQQLEDRRHHLEQLVQERTASLQEANAALKALLKRREDDKQELEDNILSNVEEIILPHIEKLKAGRITYEQRTILEVLEANANDLVSSFSRRLTSRQFSLTPTELRVANYIKHGRTTKEIAEIATLSVNTILFHRASIRRKLGITRQKLNLRSHLQLLPE
jgi:PAS domain S-box-containing protein